ncbi:HYR domain-containing protein, partial [Oceanihabitans sp. 2_MG-2023]|uniref:HYR domain-containing protein n=1 Tax=Oceanihabitans sp. 2_MG-2023 TaxID=3062661 RepID=UPI0026E13CFE
QVESGTLSFQNTLGKNFTDGTYNVFAGASMNWDTTINPSGTLEGTIDGDLNWNSIVNVVDGTYTAFNFSETDNFNWTTGTLSGGGTLTNRNVLKLIGSSNKFVSGDTTLENQGAFLFIDNGDLLIVGNGSMLNNTTEGIIDMQADAGNISWSGTSGVVNNAGLIQRTTTTGIVQIATELNNSGTIEVVSGELEFTGSQLFTNEVTGKIKGVGILDVPTVGNYTNNGTFAPGLSPGTLSVQGDYKSSETSVLDIELDGLIQGTEYDLLNITGTNVVFDGDLNVTLGFDANVGDSFTVATVSGLITTKSFTTPIYADFGCKHYTMDITYPDDKNVVVTISNKEDILPPDVLTQDITVQLDNTGNVSIVSSQIDAGSSDNCTISANLIFALDRSDFTCADIGANTVSLSVTDEAGNTSNASAIVIVEDTLSPTVLTQNITVQLDATGNASIIEDEIDNGSSDNCSISSFVLDVTNFSCANLGANTVNLTVLDSNGNSQSAPATVTVEDIIKPTIVCPNGLVEVSDGPLTLPDYYLDNVVAVSDNCEVSSIMQTPVPGTILQDGNYNVSYLITDSSGNTETCTFFVKVEDTTLSITDNVLSENDIQLFPNPVIDKVILRNSNRLELIDVMLIDVRGSVIKTIDVKGKALDIEISLENYTSGMYFIKINGTHGSIVKRLIKQ